MNYRLWLAFFAVLSSSIPGIAAPFISSFSPTYGAYNDTDYLHIYGSGFYPGTVVVKFNGVAATTVFVSSSTEIWTLVPSAAPLGPGPIFVSVNGVGTYSGTDFNVIGTGPYIDSFTPTAGTGGSGSSGTLVNIYGAHLATTGTPTVRFNGVTATYIPYYHYTNVQAYVPLGASTGPISVTTSGGTWTTDELFYVPPAITNFSPFFGRPGTNVTIRGLNFTNASSVKFNGVSAQFWVTNNTTIGAIVPTNATIGPIRIDTPAGNPAITTSNFVLQPTIYGFTPNAGPSGTAVTVTGAGFNTGGITVKFGGVTAPAASNLTSASFTVGVPNNATNAFISVTNLNGSGAHTSSGLFYLPAAITNLSSTNATSGNIQISGRNLIGTSAITFYGTSSIATTNATNNLMMSIPVPSGVITGPISVTTPAGTTNSGTIVFCGAPTINNVSPPNGLVNTLVTINGTNFQYASAVLFNGTSASFWYTNAGVIGARVPTNATTGPITIVGPAGSGAGGTFTVGHLSDLVLSLSASPSPVFVGSNLTYTVTITNKGPEAAANVWLTSTQPNIVTNLGTVNGGTKTAVTLKTTPVAVGSIANTASVASDSIDSVPSDNSATSTTVVWPIPVLKIVPQNASQFQLSWPAPLSNFTLQFSTNVAVTAAWSNLTDRPVISNGESVLWRSNVGTNGYYRLKN